MDWLGPTWAIYQNCVARGARLAVRNWAVPATMFLYVFVLAASDFAARYLGMLGGFLSALAFAFCAGSFLSLVETIVRTSRVTWEDFRDSLGAYVGEVLGVMFTFWVIGMVARLLLLPLPNGEILLLGVELTLLILLNPVPELIYLGHHSLFELLSASYAFVVENWVEWFPINIALLVIYAVLRSQPALGLYVVLIEAAATSLFLYFLMVVRGLLFLELYGTTRRSRTFRYRAGS